MELVSNMMSPYYSGKQIDTVPGAERIEDVGPRDRNLALRSRACERFSVERRRILPGVAVIQQTGSAGVGAQEVGISHCLDMKLFQPQPVLSQRAVQGALAGGQELAQPSMF
jgi:hypothetical protein